MAQTDVFSPMFDNWVKIFCQLILVRVGLMCVDIQLRAYDYLYQDLPDFHWYLEPLHDVIFDLNQFQNTLEDHNTFLSWVLGWGPCWRN